MNTPNTVKTAGMPVGAYFFERLWEESWTYIKTVVDVVHEPVIILDHKLCVMAANESFYRTFRVQAKDTERKVVYELGNGQWDIPALRNLLEEILPKNTFFKGFEVSHDFPYIGHRVMMLNARQIHFQDNADSELVPPIILLAMEDVTDMMAVAETFAAHTKQMESKLMDRTRHLEVKIGTLEKEIVQLKEKK